MLDHINIENILFLDIETVPKSPDYASLDDRMKKLWDKKSERIRQNESDTPEDLYGRAGIYAEFGKIICICAGTFRNNELRVKAFSGDDEHQLLLEFAGLLNTYFSKPEHILCAHNGKEFDFPYIARRMLINHIRIPAILDTAGKKPWDVNHLDTMELWKFGDFKNYTSLELLAAVFNIPTPKDDIDGSQVGEVYWQNKDLKRIVSYCHKDVITIVQIVRSYRGESLVPQEHIVTID
jgi:3'-5' exonuclease